MSTTSQQPSSHYRNVPKGRKTSRRMPPRDCPIAEDRPPAHKMWRDRQGNAIYFALRSHEGRAFADIRIYFTDSSGVLKPTPRGVTFAINKLPEVAKALSKMCAEARDMGLLKTEAAE